MWQKTNLLIQHVRYISNKIKPKECTPSTIIVKLLKTKNEEKNLESSRGDGCFLLPVREKSFTQQHISHLKQWRPEGSGTRFYQVLEANSEFYAQ